jgi:hypothetical protein
MTRLKVATKAFIYQFYTQLKSRTIRLLVKQPQANGLSL